MIETDFMECETCRAKPGTPTLCKSCLHNRAAIDQLTRDALERMSFDFKSGGQLEILPNFTEYRPDAVLTQVKYFHYVEADGQKVMIGFQTYAELMNHLEPGGDWVDDTTIREASK